MPPCVVALALIQNTLLAFRRLYNADGVFLKGPLADKTNEISFISRKPFQHTTPYENHRIFYYLQRN